MKKIVLITSTALLLGCLLTFLVFKNNEVRAKKNVTSVNAKAFQIGVYNEENNALKIAIRNNGLVVKEENKYRVYVAIIHNEETINRIAKYFNNIELPYYIKEITVPSSSYEKVKIYEELINKSSPDTYNTILKDILKIYEGVLWVKR